MDFGAFVLIVRFIRTVSYRTELTAVPYVCIIQLRYFRRQLWRFGSIRVVDISRRPEVEVRRERFQPPDGLGRNGG